MQDSQTESAQLPLHVQPAATIDAAPMPRTFSPLFFKRFQALLKMISLTLREVGVLVFVFQAWGSFLVLMGLKGAVAAEGVDDTAAEYGLLVLSLTCLLLGYAIGVIATDEAS